MSHLLVTNDYPPKLGGIQSYLYELWRRLPEDEFRVLTRAYPGAAAFDAQAPHVIVRLGTRPLWPSRRTAAAIERERSRIGAGLVVFDPLIPLATLGPRLPCPYGVVLHGAELTVPARLAGSRAVARRTLAGATLLIVGGNYPEHEVRRLLGRATPPIVNVPPGVDGKRFHPLSDEGARRAARARLGVSPDALLVVSVSRLVPRKGMDVLIEAAARLKATHPRLEVLIGGRGRDDARLRALARKTGAPVRFAGRVADEDLPDLLASADVGAMLCRSRWLGLEQEGFGIVFLEGSASGVAQLAGLSGGSQDAVVHERTGLVVDRPADVVPVTAALGRLLDDAALRGRLGDAGRAHALEDFDYDRLAATLHAALRRHGG